MVNSHSPAVGSGKAVLITDAAPASSKEIDHRHNQYMLAMAIRTACFFGLLFVPGPWRWLFVPGAAILPAIAVMVANIGDRRAAATTVHTDEEARARPELTSHQVIRGETQEDA